MDNILTEWDLTDEELESIPHTPVILNTPPDTSVNVRASRYARERAVGRATVEKYRRSQPTPEGLSNIVLTREHDLSKITDNSFCLSAHGLNRLYSFFSSQIEEAVRVSYNKGVEDGKRSIADR